MFLLLLLVLLWGVGKESVGGCHQQATPPTHHHPPPTHQLPTATHHTRHAPPHRTHHAPRYTTQLAAGDEALAAGITAYIAARNASALRAEVEAGGGSIEVVLDGTRVKLVAGVHFVWSAGGLLEVGS